MPERSLDLPDFRKPPVTEVVLGVQFKTDKPLRIPYLGLFWRTVRKSFPDFREQPPLGPVIERLDNEPTDPPRIGMSPIPPVPRCWFVDSTGTKIIQLQPDRFLHNWRKVTGEEEYPRYEMLRDEFIGHWQEFVSFLNDEDLGTPIVTQAEVTYVNHLPMGSCWSDADDMPKVFSCLKHLDEPNLFGPMETMEFTIRRRLPDNRGRLHVTAVPAFNTNDKSVIMRMVLTARGPVANSSDEAILDWMEMGRVAIVNSFTALTTPEAHKFWERTK